MKIFKLSLIVSLLFTLVITLMETFTYFASEMNVVEFLKMLVISSGITFIVIFIITYITYLISNKINSKKR